MDWRQWLCVAICLLGIVSTANVETKNPLSRREITLISHCSAILNNKNNFKTQCLRRLRKCLEIDNIEWHYYYARKN